MRYVSASGLASLNYRSLAMGPGRDFRPNVCPLGAGRQAEEAAFKSSISMPLQEVFSRWAGWIPNPPDEDA